MQNSVNNNSKLSKKRFLSLVIAVALTCCLVLSSCSTPETAVTIKKGDTVVETYTSGEYLAFLYEFTMNYLNGNAQYYSDPWAQEFRYGEWEAPEDDSDAEDPREKMSASNYLAKITQDEMLKRYAVFEKMNDMGVTLTDEEQKSFDEFMDTYSLGNALGFNRESFRTAYITQLYTQRLYDAIYGEDGTTPIDKKEIQDYYDQNVITYKSISFPLVDGEGEDLEEAEIKEIREMLAKYKETFESSKDFDAAIKQYDADANKDLDDDATPQESSKNIIATDAKTSTDEDLIKAIQSVNVEDSKIVEYSAGGTKKTIALIYRIDPTKTEDYTLDKLSVQIGHFIKDDEFLGMIDELAKSYSITVSKSAAKKCTPKHIYDDLIKEEQ